MMIPMIGFFPLYVCFFVVAFGESNKIKVFSLSTELNSFFLWCTLTCHVSNWSCFSFGSQSQRHFFSHVLGVFWVLKVPWRNGFNRQAEGELKTAFFYFLQKFWHHDCSPTVVLLCT